MKCIVDNKKIIDYLVDNQLTALSFIKSSKISKEALDRALNKEPVTLSTAAKIVKAIGAKSEEVVIASMKVSKKRKKPIDLSGLPERRYCNPSVYSDSDS